jgi:cyanate lyase
MNDAKSVLGRWIVERKRERKLSWAALGEIAGQSPVWTCAACLGQMAVPHEAAARLGEALGLTMEEVGLLEQIPYRGALPAGPPTDPLIYRFHELVQVYGTTWKELIGEEFGDGIMSAIDFSMSVEREPDPAGDRVRIVMSGKFLPFRRY